MIYLDLKLEYDDARVAETVYRALQPDNKGYVDSKLDGKVIIFKLKADTAGTLRNTADDLMACVKIAEEASGLVSGAAPDPDGDALSE
jgi:tRNA threonylcarbamoyladenosine modification (KEOPS) complex  Pcc1 subunit